MAAKGSEDSHVKSFSLWAALELWPGYFNFFWVGKRGIGSKRVGRSYP